jgi:hypothetical protein
MSEIKTDAQHVVERLRDPEEVDRPGRRTIQAWLHASDSRTIDVIEDMIDAGILVREGHAYQLTDLEGAEIDRRASELGLSRELSTYSVVQAQLE